MRMIVKVKTPPGQAEGTEKQFRLWILKKIRAPPVRYISPANDEFFWELDVTYGRYITIQRNIAFFHTLAGAVMDKVSEKSWLRKMADLNNATIAETRALLQATTVEIIKNATAAEIAEADLTYWEKIKRTFRKEEK